MRLSSKGKSNCVQSQPFKTVSCPALVAQICRAFLESTMRLSDSYRSWGLWSSGTENQFKNYK